MIDFSFIDFIIADIFGYPVTLRSAGEPDATITVVRSDAVQEGALDGTRDYSVAAGPVIAEGDHLIDGEGVYRVGSITVESTGAMRFRGFRVA